MARRLFISAKLLSLKRRFQITDEADEILYECTWKFAFFSPPWKLSKKGSEVATFRRKIFSWAPTWNVTSVDGNFRMRQRIFSFRRRVVVKGGIYDGAEFNGSLFGMTFTLRAAGQTIAEAHRELLTIRDKHYIDLLIDTPQAELLTAIVMASLLVQKETETSKKEEKVGA
jgi:uncharacterized protein YxjI